MGDFYNPATTQISQLATKLLTYFKLMYGQHIKEFVGNVPGKVIRHLL